jgi:hypothetical protein
MSTKSPSAMLPLTHHPVDRAAGMALARGVHFDVRVGDHHVHSDAPLPTRPLPAINRATLPDLTGQVFGRLTVVGLARDVPKRWVVRCRCSRFELRSTKALRDSDPDRMRCMACERTRQLAEIGEAAARGRNLPGDWSGR